VVVVPVGDDNVGYVGFILVRDLTGFAEGGFKDWNVLVSAFASVDQCVWVALADDVGICPCGNVELDSKV